MVKRLAAFRQALIPQFERLECNPKKLNLNPVQSKMLHNLKRDNTILTVNTDKGLGPALMDYERYAKDMFDDHLNDETTFELLTSNRSFS